MKIRIDDTIYEGTGAEILEQLRLAAFDPTEFPDTESYLWQLRSNFIRMTDRDCVLPEHGLEEQARVLFSCSPPVRVAFPPQGGRCPRRGRMRGTSVPPPGGL